MYREVKTDANLKSTPVIILSAIAKKTFYNSIRTLNSYRGQAVPDPEAYIEKPPETEELLKIVRKCVEG